MSIKLLLLTSLLLMLQNALAATTLIHAGELLAVPGEKTLKDQTITVVDGKITAVTAGFLQPEVGDGSLVIDLRDSFVMPGLMDMHVHLQGELGPNNDRDALKMSNQLVGMRTVHHGTKTLMAGFTTVRDVGSNSQYMYAYRDAVNRGWVAGPRVIAAGGVGITGGHADVSGMKPELMEFYTDRSICDGPYDCRRAARDAIKYGADLIKITSTGGVMTDRATGTGQQMEMDELKEVVLAAKRMGKKVASHAHQEDGIIAALQAGVHSIEHGTYTGPEAIKWFKKTGAYLVPTLLAGDTVSKLAKNTDILPPAVAAKAIKVGQDMQGNFIKSYEAGVNIAFGTDSGISPHGTNAQEAVLMSQAGMPHDQILLSATLHAAALINMQDQLGSIEVGKLADIIATKDSPLADIEALLAVHFVMKEGAVHKHEAP
ncbi:metal-dependent hydrolase family protein [Marinicella meishanensis]|uniref:metal-dependent hydrolase family protein n=1 Tax=Marinicella meishanensis TaxID=2873263 RepID=UPI001CBF1107|nr:amidohydrolase family protein [Marinicella sp. NBU2979]